MMISAVSSDNPAQIMHSLTIEMPRVSLWLADVSSLSLVYTVCCLFWVTESKVRSLVSTFAGTMAGLERSAPPKSFLQGVSQSFCITCLIILIGGNA